MLFRSLGVFVGGFDLSAAATVSDWQQETRARPVMSTLHALINKNLVRSETLPSGEQRFLLLETIREFALDALAQQSDDALEQARQRHAEYFARILKYDSDEAYRVMAVEQHNARAALRWLLDHKHPLTGELARFMGYYFDRAGLQNEGRHTLPEVLSADIEMAPLVHINLLSLASVNAWHQHRFEEALRYGHEAVARSRAINAQPQVADILIVLSGLYIEMDDGVQAKRAALEALQISRTIQTRELIVGALDTLGLAGLILGDVSAAETCLEEAYALCQAPDFREHVYAGMACLGMGKIALSRRDYERALGFLREGLERSKVAVLKLWLLDALASAIGTNPDCTTADVQRAAKIWGAAEALHEKIGTVAAPGDRRRTDALIAEARTRILPATFAAAWAEGRNLSLHEAVALAMMDGPSVAHAL